MPFQMMDGGDGLLERVSKSFGGSDPDNQRAHQAGPIRNGYRIHVTERDSCGLQRVVDYWENALHVLARCDLRDDASPPRVKIGLAGNYVRKYPAIIGDHSGGGLVTARLDP